MQRVSLHCAVGCGSSPRLLLLLGQTAVSIFHQEAKQEEVKPAGKDVSPKAAEDVDLNATRHRGQVALRRLYHESKRPLVVFYSSPSCGPCRSLKPIMYKLTDEFQDKVGLPPVSAVGWCCLRCCSCDAGPLKSSGTRCWTALQSASGPLALWFAVACAAAPECQPGT